MSSSTISITVASVPHREEVVAELWLDASQEHLGEIYLSDGALRVVLYPPPSGTTWDLDLDALRAALEQGRARLVDEK